MLYKYNFLIVEYFSYNLCLKNFLWILPFSTSSFHSATLTTGSDLLSLYQSHLSEFATV